MQHPAPIGVLPVLDHLAHELHAESAAAALFEHVDVGEIHEAGCVAVDRAGEADLAAVAIEPHEAFAGVE